MNLCCRLSCRMAAFARPGVHHLVSSLAPRSPPSTSLNMSLCGDERSSRRVARKAAERHIPSFLIRIATLTVRPSVHIKPLAGMPSTRLMASFQLHTLTLTPAHDDCSSTSLHQEQQHWRQRRRCPRHSLLITSSSPISTGCSGSVSLLLSLALSSSALLSPIFPVGVG